MKDQNRDDFYEGPPLEEPDRWHDGAVVPTADDAGRTDAPGDRVGAPLVDADVPEPGEYPLPDVVERPHQPADGLPSTALTTDPSLSRAVDRAAAGAPVLDAGYDRGIEGEPPGPLEPEREAQPDDDAPAGQWGSG